MTQTRNYKFTLGFYKIDKSGKREFLTKVSTFGNAPNTAAVYDILASYADLAARHMGICPEGFGYGVKLALANQMPDILTRTACHTSIKIASSDNLFLQIDMTSTVRIRILEK